MINPKISLVWSTTKPIAPFSCTPRVQQVHTKSEVVHPTPGHLGLGVIFYTLVLIAYLNGNRDILVTTGRWPGPAGSSN